jgi:hypothetical protein
MRETFRIAAFGSLKTVPQEHCSVALWGLIRFALGGSLETAPWEYSSFALWGLVGFAFLKARLGSLESLVCLESAFHFADEGCIILSLGGRFVGRFA